MITETITGVALLREDGAMWSLPAPARHANLFALASFQGADAEPCRQGFTTSQGRFVDRNYALCLAQEAGQTIRAGYGGELYSEDLW